MNRNKLHHPIGDFVCFCSEARAPRSIYQEVPVADFCDSPANQNSVEIIVKLLGSFPNFFGKFLGAIRLAFFPIRPCHCREQHVLVHLPPFLDLTTFIIKQYFPYSWLQMQNCESKCGVPGQSTHLGTGPPFQACEYMRIVKPWGRRKFGNRINEDHSVHVWDFSRGSGFIRVLTICIFALGLWAACKRWVSHPGRLEVLWLADAIAGKGQNNDRRLRDDFVASDFSAFGGSTYMCVVAMKRSLSLSLRTLFAWRHTLRHDYCCHFANTWAQKFHKRAIFLTVSSMENAHLVELRALAQVDVERINPIHWEHPFPAVVTHIQSLPCDDTLLRTAVRTWDVCPRNTKQLTACNCWNPDTRCQHTWHPEFLEMTDQLGFGSRGSSPADNTNGL